MRRNDGLWEMMGIVIGWTLLLVLMVGAQPGNALTPLHPFHTPYGVTHCKGFPGRDFAGKPELRSNLGNTAEIRQELEFTQPILPSARRHAAKGVFTPEQLEKLLARRVVARMLHRLSAESQKLLLTPETPELKTLLQVQAAIAKKNVTLEKEPFENFAQARTTLTPKQYLQELQTLRL